ncbi:nuclear transport factor 2 family protein [Nocardioides donggukensis]|uniref:Nuclear transport factor 2 family protein n=1 Tax=Nocardioides donggukensis TaxID=2774019 RepID=A0A927K5S0_9ACTN|nr:nuclear transport factor 2 family protein [Nocardioides donggukensis]MBD8870441.1 nuclear transport factor 2 family protein [Nocardioides donggukensis]
MPTPAEIGLARWHDVIASHSPDRLPELIAEDAVFRSPAVHAPQEGRELVAAYLGAAMVVLGDGFSYVDEWIRERDAILEFTSTVGDLEISGIDRITWDDNGRIVAFTVMVRPVRALHALMERMAERLGHGGVRHT